MKLHPVEVISRERYGDHVRIQYRWTGEPPQPGQFVMVRAAGHGLDPFLSRPLFAHDYEEGDVASLLIVVRGRGTALLAEEGSALLVSDPLGKGFQVTEDGPVALVGGGVWVSPLKLLARSLRWRGIEHDVYLESPAAASGAYLGFLKENFPGATLIETTGGTGSAEFLDWVGDLARYESIYVSGTAETLAAVRSAAAGVVPAQLAVRERMACANGSCYGCAVPVWAGGEMIYARACVDGPVFEAAALAW